MSRKLFAALVEEIPSGPSPAYDPVLFPRAKRTPDQRNDAISIAEREAAAYARGLSEGRDLVRGEIEQLAEIHRKDMKVAVEAARQDQLQIEGAELAARLNAALAETEAALVEKVRPVLQSLLEATLVERALNELGQILRRAIATDGTLEMTIVASANLVEAVKRQLPAGWNRATFIEGDEPGIRVAAGAVDIRVELDTWRGQIAAGQL